MLTSLTRPPADSASEGAENAPVFVEAAARCSYAHPDFFWRAEIVIRADGAATLKRCTGYATEGPGCRIRRTRLPPEALAMIRAAAETSGLAETHAAEILGDGSMAEALRHPALIKAMIHLGDAKVFLPERTHPDDAARVQAVFLAISAALPTRFCRLSGN